MRFEIRKTGSELEVVLTSTNEAIGLVTIEAFEDAIASKRGTFREWIESELETAGYTGTEKEIEALVSDVRSLVESGNPRG